MDGMPDSGSDHTARNFIFLVSVGVVAGLIVWVLTGRGRSPTDPGSAGRGNVPGSGSSAGASPLTSPSPSVPAGTPSPTVAASPGITFLDQLSTPSFVDNTPKEIDGHLYTHPQFFALCNGFSELNFEYTLSRHYQTFHSIVGAIDEYAPGTFLFEVYLDEHLAWSESHGTGNHGELTLDVSNTVKLRLRVVPTPMSCSPIQAAGFGDPFLTPK